MMGGRRYLVLAAAALAVGWGRACLASSGSLAYEVKRAAGVRLHVITANLNDPDVHVTLLLARRGIGSTESFGSMVQRGRPAAAVTGTFFCVHTFLPTGDLVIEGERVHHGVVGPALAITPDNHAVYIPYRYTTAGYGGKYTSVVCGGPTLIRGGRIVLDPRAEGFTDRSLLRPTARTAVGITARNKLLLVAVSSPTRLGQLAKAMQALGAVYAVSMDGGSSSALSYRDQIVVKPRRALTNLLAVYATQQSWQQAKGRLSPVG
jgi:hypothetical protein